MADNPTFADDDFDYADPAEPLDYRPYRQGTGVPEWKDEAGRYPKLPVRDYGTSRQVDQEIYRSADIHRQEWRKIFRPSWMMVGHLTDVPKRDSFMKVDRGPESVLIFRGEGEELHAMYNFCTHRGNQLVLQEFGSTRKLVCPFHKWEFGTDGELKKIQDRETFRKETICHDLNLPKVRVENWRGWIFINFDPDAPPLTEFLGEGYIERAAAYEFDGLVRIRDVEQIWPCNWKVAREIFLEGYHVQATHPQYNGAVDAYHAQHDLFENGHAISIFQFMSPNPQYTNLPPELAEEHRIFLTEAGVKEEDWPKHWRDVPRAVIEAKRGKVDAGVDYSRFTDGQLIDDWNSSIFPATEFFWHPEGYFIQHFLPHPTDHDKCVYQVQVYSRPKITILPSFMGVQEADLSGKYVLPRTHIAEDDMENLGPVIKQDRALVERLQKAVYSEGFRGSVYSEQEIRIRHFHEEYYRLMERPHYRDRNQ